MPAASHEYDCLDFQRFRGPSDTKTASLSHLSAGKILPERLDGTTESDLLTSEASADTCTTKCDTGFSAGNPTQTRLAEYDTPISLKAFGQRECRVQCHSSFCKKDCFDKISNQKTFELTSEGGSTGLNESKQSWRSEIFSSPIWLESFHYQTPSFLEDQKSKDKVRSQINQYSSIDLPTLVVKDESTQSLKLGDTVHSVLESKGDVLADHCYSTINLADVSMTESENHVLLQTATVRSKRSAPLSHYSVVDLPAASSKDQTGDDRLAKLASSESLTETVSGHHYDWIPETEINSQKEAASQNQHSSKKTKPALDKTSRCIVM